MMLIKPRLNNRGFSLVEATAALPVLAIAIAGVLAVTYLCFANSWLKDAAEESALCVAEKVSTSICRHELEQKTSTVLPIGKFSSLKVELRETQVVVDYKYQALDVTLENQILLRLPVSKAR